MIYRFNRIKNVIFPNKKINIFVFSILFLSIIAGALFASLMGLNDKNLVIDKITMFINNINSGSLKSILVIKNSLLINFSYIILIWIFGMTIIGILFNIFLLFIKGFIFSFSISSFIITYGYKGIILSILYLLFGQLLNILVVLIITIYSIMFTIRLLRFIFKNDHSSSFNTFLKNYFVILLFSVILSIISSLSESFLLPALLKLIVKIFI